MNAVVTAPQRAERLTVFDPVPVLDSARFEHMHRIANLMARTPLVPESLVCRYEGSGPNRKAIALEWEAQLANCFLVTNQAVRWGLDPFAVAQCCSVVHGRLMFEGKLIAAVLDAKLGEQLSFEWNNATGDAFGIRIEGSPDARGKPRIIEGTVGQWKTSGSNSPWSKPSDHRRQLVYRGTRDWARMYEPAVLLGVYTPDEMEELRDTARTAPTSGPPRQVRREAPPPIEQKVTPAKPSADEAKPARENVDSAAKDAVQATDLDAIVAQFERQAAEASTRELLDEAEALVQPYQDDNLFGLAQRTLIANAWEAADERLTKAAAAKAEADRAVQKVHEIAARQDAKLAVDMTHPAYLRGAEDRKRGLKRCLKPEIREDPGLLALWEAGHSAA